MRCRPVNSIFNYYGTLLKVVNVDTSNDVLSSCKSCYIRSMGAACLHNIKDLHLPLDITKERDTRITGICGRSRRNDHINVCFVKVKETIKE